MSEKPILFTTEMMHAIYDGAKTQTRRIVKPNHEEAISAYIDKFGNEYEKEKINSSGVKSPYGYAGDSLWVRQTWATLKKFDDLAPRNIPHGGVRWPAVCMEAWLGAARDAAWRGKWRPSIFMPRWASDTILPVTRLRVQHLRDITNADAKAEGTSGLQEFRLLWDKINGERQGGRYQWDRDPLVWVVDFGGWHRSGLQPPDMSA